VESAKTVLALFLVVTVFPFIKWKAVGGIPTIWRIRTLFGGGVYPTFYRLGTSKSWLLQLDHDDTVNVNIRSSEWGIYYRRCSMGASVKLNTMQ
jgi:hypothetical protein